MYKFKLFEKENIENIVAGLECAGGKIQKDTCHDASFQHSNTTFMDFNNMIWCGMK